MSAVSQLHPNQRTQFAPITTSEWCLSGREQMQRIIHETGQSSIREVAAESKTACGHPYIPPVTRCLKRRIDPEQSPYTCMLPEHKPVWRRREMIDLLAVEEPQPKPAKIRAVSVRGSDRPVVQMGSAVVEHLCPAQPCFLQAPEMAVAGREQRPEFSLAQRARVLPYKDPREFQRIVDGLSKAGLP